LGDLRGVRVVVQEYGAAAGEFYEALQARGALVRPLVVYRYALPEDTGPLRAALRLIAAGETEVALFTSRSQVEHALLVAGEEGLEERVRAGLLAGVIGSIGPVCSEALRAEGLEPDVEPTHAKMGHLVKETAMRARGILAAKGRV